MSWQQQLEVLKANLLALGMRRLIALAVVGASVIAAIAATGYFASRADSEPLYVGLSQADVARIGSALREAGFPFDVSSDGTRVMVRRSQAPAARMYLAEKGLPAGATAGYELFDKLGPLGLTSFMQDVTRTRALEGELVRTIQTIKGVKSARVHITMPESVSFRRARQPASASIVIRMDGAREAAIPQIIRHLVSAAVPGLPSENVSVMSTDGAILAAGGDAAGLGSAKMIELERSVARQLQDNIRRTLSPYLGVDNVEVSVSARINMDKRQVSEQVFDPDSKSERSSRVIKDLGNARNSAPRPAVSVEQNLPGEQGNGGGPEQSKKSNERREELTNFELSSKTISTVSEGHRIETLTVAVVINRKRLAQISGGGAGDAATIDKLVKEIEAITTSAAGIDMKRGDKISIAAVDFIDPQADAADKRALPEILARHLDTFIIALTALAAAAIFVWFGLLPAIRAIVPRTEPALAGGPLRSGAPAVLPPPDGPVQLPAADSAERPLAGPKVNATQSRLAELIEQDEKQVAEILRQWLSKAA